MADLNGVTVDPDIDERPTQDEIDEMPWLVISEEKNWSCPEIYDS